MSKPTSTFRELIRLLSFVAFAGCALVAALAWLHTMGWDLVIVVLLTCVLLWGMFGNL